jgi:hypothetical protein
LIGSLSYRGAGTLLFILALLIVLAPLIYRLAKRIFKTTVKEINWLQPKTASLLFLTFGLSCFVFFFFNTEMHERYLVPAVIFFALWAVIQNKLWPYITYALLSIGVFMNVEKLLGYLPVNHLAAIWGSRPIAIIITLALVLGMIQLYLGFLSLKENTALKPSHHA